MFNFQLIFVPSHPKMAIQVTYRRTRRLTMRIVKSGDVHISAPIGMPRSRIEEFIEKNRDWIVKARENTLNRQQSRQAFYDQLPLITAAQKREAKNRLEPLVIPMVEHYSRVIGVTQPEIRYRAMTSRWGTCKTREGIVCFSLYLLLVPEWCIEHVVVHELCHLLEPSHNAHFHALMDRYFPRWREARREMRSKV